MFKARVANYFYSLLTIVRLRLSASGAENDLSYQSLLINGTWRGYRYSPAPLNQNECKCSTDFNCILRNLGIECTYGANCTVSTIIWTVPGFVKSCTNVETALASDLRCFYDQMCVNNLLSLYNYDMPNRLPLPEATLAIRALNSSIPSRFMPNTTWSILFGQVMIEEWEMEASFDGYYSSCAPSECTYTYSQRMDIGYVVTTITSLFGGLIVILRLLIPKFILLLNWIYRICKREQQTNTNDSQIQRESGIVQTIAM